MDENKIEKLLYEIGNESIEAPEQLISKTKDYIQYEPLIYAIPLSFIVNLLFIIGMVYFYMSYINLKYFYLIINIAFTISNAVIAVFLLLFFKFNKLID